MFIIAILLQTLGFYAMHNRSSRAVLRMDRLSRWFQRSSKAARVLAVTALIMSFVLLINLLGPGAGVLMGFVLLMTIGSLIILLVPLIVRNSDAR